MFPDPALPFHTRAVIISSGDEIILGQLLDTNAQRIAIALTSRGVIPIEHLSVPDDLSALVAALRSAARSAPLVILSGGLGPTDGDLSRAALSALTCDSLVLDQEARADIAAMLAKRNREMTPRQERQAYRPSRARCLPNHMGTAPGLHMVHENVDIFALPGPPGELAPMLEREVLPRLRTDPARTVITQLAHIVGIPEADCVTKLGDLTKRTNMPLVGITASGGILTLRIRYEGSAPHPEAQRLINETISSARAKLGDHLFSPPRCLDAFGGCLDAFPSSQKPNLVNHDNAVPTLPACGAGETRLARGVSPGTTRLEPQSPRSGRHTSSASTQTSPSTSPTLASLALPNSPGSELLIRTILDHLIAHNHTLATIESCTGGMLGELITAIPGSSAAYLGGFVTYANSLKEHIGVDHKTLQHHGAVSPQVATQMANRGRDNTNATFTLAITGIAGPEGGTPDKPVGTMYIAMSCSSPEGGGMFIAPAMNAEGAEGKTTTGPTKKTGVTTPQVSTQTRHFLFTGDREDIRRRAAITALTMLYFHQRGHSPNQPRLLWEVTEPT